MKVPEADAKPARGRWLLALAVAMCGTLASLALALVVVRVGLDWTDSFPYTSTSERRYAAIAVLALVTFGTGTFVTAAIARGMNLRRRR